MGSMHILNLQGLFGGAASCAHDALACGCQRIFIRTAMRLRLWEALMTRYCMIL